MDISHCTYCIAQGSYFNVHHLLYPEEKVDTVYFLITAPKKKNLRRRLALKLERKIYTSVSAATYMTVHWRYN